MKIGTLRVTGIPADDIRDMLTSAISPAELQNWINDRLDERPGSVFNFKDVNDLFDFIAENLTEETDL